MLRLVIAFAVFVLLPAVAHAQPRKLQRALEQNHRPVVVEEAPTGPTRKSPGGAVALSLGVTTGSLALLVAGGASGTSELAVPGLIGFVVGPSTGLWYAGRSASAGTAVRLVGAGALVGAFVWQLGCHGPVYDAEDNFVGDGHGSCDGPSALAVGGVVALVAGAVWEIGDAYLAAEEHNRRHGFDLAVTPTAMPANGGIAPGLALSGRF